MSTPDAGRSNLGLYRKVQAHLFFRLLTAIFILLVTLLFQFRKHGNLLAPPLTPLYLFSAVLFCVTIIAVVGLNRASNLRFFAYLQFLFDVLGVTFLIYISGGVDSPFSFLYMPLIISAAVLLFRRGAFLVAGASTIAYGALLDLQYFGWIRPLQFLPGANEPRTSELFFYSLVVTTTVFFLVAFLSGYLAEQFQKSMRDAEEKARDLRNLETFYRDMVETMGAGLFTVDRQGMVDYANDAAHVILGAKPGRLQGCPLSSVFPEVLKMVQDMDSHPEGGDTVSDHQRPVRLMEVTLPGGDGSNRSLFVAGTRAVSSDKKNSGERLIVIFFDQTRLKAMEAHVRRLEQLAFAGKLAGEIVHEIKNPLAAISGVAQILDLECPSLSPKFRTILHRELDRINDLVTRYLWLAREARDGDAARPVSLAEALEGALESLELSKHLTSKHDVRLRLDEEAIVRMPPRHLHQILWHLLANACEALPEGGTIRISARMEKTSRDSSMVKLEVADSGPGIPEDVREKIFEPLWTTKEGHMGLGLSIVYRLLEESGGRIWVEADPTFPTCFALLLPAF